MKQVFISYSSEDLEKMQEIAALLESLGLRAWTDFDIKRGSAVWTYTIEKEIRASHAVLILMSRDASRSRWVEREFNYAERFGCRIYSILLKDSREDDIPIYLAERNHIDARKGLAQVSDLAEELLGSTRRWERRTKASRRVAKSLPAELETAPGAVWTEPGTGMAFVWVPPGTFEMGDDSVSEESPSHVVRISGGMWVGRHPVTNGDYGQFVQATGSPPRPQAGSHRFGHEHQPVVALTWQDAKDFCRWLTSELPDGWEADLPTEAEWEWAARGPDRRPFPWGDAPPNAELADFDQDPTAGRPAQVGTHPHGAGPWGAEEQAGSVGEWCRDHWAEGYGATLDQRVDPCHQTLGVDSVAVEAPRVVRGGSWASLPEGLRCSARLKFLPSVADDFLGFRVICRQAISRESTLRVSAANFESTLINNSRAATLSEAISEWKLQFKGYSGAPLSCQVCGQRIKHHALIANEWTGAKLLLGLTCYGRVRENLNAAQIVNPLLSNALYRHRRRDLAVRRTLGKLRSVSDWEIPDLDYGSWKRWFIEQESQGRLPLELSEGMEELRRDGFLASNDQVDRFLAFHNAHRKFPSQILLPHTRLRALYRDPHKIPLTLTIDEALRLARWGRSKDELGPFILDRLCEAFDISNRPKKYKLLFAYNFLMVFYRSYAGLANDSQREWFVCNDLLLRLSPAISGLILGPRSKAKLDAEVEATSRLLAELLLPQFREAASRDPEMETLAPRVEHVAATGQVPMVWALASTPPPAAPTEGTAPVEVAEEFRLLHECRGLPALLDVELSCTARGEWEKVSGTPAIDVVIAAGWLEAPFCCSSAAILMQRRTSLLAIGLNHRWRSAPSLETQAVLSLIIRDLLGKPADPDGLYRVHRFLTGVEMPFSLRNRDPKRAAELLVRLGLDVQPSMQDHPPHIITNRKGRKVHYDRWSHTLFIPGSLTQANEEEIVTLPSSLASIASLDPPSLRYPKQTRSRDYPIGERLRWYQLEWEWIQPEFGEIDAYFCRRHYVGFLPGVVRESRELTDVLNKIIGGTWRVMR